MRKNVFLTFGLVFLAVFALLAPAERAYALSAQQYFEDGNRLLRDHLYWAALLRYEQAGMEGMDSPLLHYNIGVAHYRAGQHIRARDSLTRALEDPQLRILAQYNLGLNAYELGDPDEALRWFRLVRDQQQDEKLQEFAVVAIARIRDELAEPDDFEVRVAKREEVRDFTTLELRAKLGYGFDDNVFRSPDQAYVDFADPNTPIVSSMPIDGAFIPLTLSAKYIVNGRKFEGFYAAYRLSGRYYEEEALQDANEYQHQLSFGSEYRRKTETREREVHSAFTVAHHDEVYYDPDDYRPRTVNGEDVSDRMNYLRYGPELSLRQSGEHLTIGANIKGQLWNYEEQTEIPEYDHEYMYVDLYGQYKFTRNSLFRIAAKGYSRRFGDRPGYDLDGQQRVGNPNIRYDYYALTLTARQRVFDSLWFGFNIERTERIDQYVGYNDYTRDSVGAELQWTPGVRFNVKASSNYYLYDYPNAFAFNNPNRPSKTQEAADATVIASFRITQRLSIVAEARYRETVSNDFRIQNERNQYLLGVRWEQ